MTDDAGDLLGGQGDNRLTATRHGFMLFNRRDTIIGRSLAYYGEYFEREAALFGQLLRPGDVAADVGANIGAHTLPLARKVGPQGRVLAFEPIRLNFQLLCANMALNDVTWADCRPIGLGAENATIHIRDVMMDEDDNFGALALNDLQASAGRPVAVRRFDDAFDGDRLRLVKIDVEGMEAAVLKGACQTIMRLRPALYVENDRPEESRALILLLQEMDYACFWFLPPYHNPANFRGRTEPLLSEGFTDDGRRLYGRGMGINLLCVPRKAATGLSGLPAVRDADEHPLHHSDNPRFVRA